MQKFVVMDRAGYPTAFYSVPDIHKEAPKGAVSISQETWQEWINYPTRTRMVEGKLIPDEVGPEPEEVSLSDLKQRLDTMQAKLDEQATELTSIKSRTLTR